MSHTLLEYASEQRILDILIKERVKIAISNKLVQDYSVAQKKRQKISAFAQEVASMMPPRNLWLRPRRADRMIIDQETNCTKKRRTKQILSRSIALTINAHRKAGSNNANYPYLNHLDKFVESIREMIASERIPEFRSMHTMGQEKKVNDKGEQIMRPISSFRDLREKVLISLVNGFLSEKFDSLLHEEVLSYRIVRTYHNKPQVLTNRDNAIQNLQEYRRKYYRKGIYVAECDIQKYYDTINHDVILKYFDAFADKVKQQDAEFEYGAARRIVEAYLDAYSFYNVVDSLNQSYKSEYNRTKGKRGVLLKKVEGPKTELFFERGCYDCETFDANKSKIGIPQGGALSGLISNVILSSIDCESVLQERDERRFFSRYGDDILLMHTSKEKCQELITRYRDKLTENKLLYHNFVSVGEFRNDDGRIEADVWNQKSREPFLWGRNAADDDAMDWIGFLGYEVRYTGEVRIRRVSLNEKFKRIKRGYHKAKNTKLAKGCAKFENETKLYNAIVTKIGYFSGNGLSTASSLNVNKYSNTQAARLDGYSRRLLYRLLYKIYRRNNLTKAQLDRYWQLSKTLNCFNYRSTIKG